MAESSEETKEGDFHHFLAKRKAEEIKILRRAALHKKSWVLVENIPD